VKKRSVRQGIDALGLNFCPRKEFNHGHMAARPGLKKEQSHDHPTFPFGERPFYP
jgi:hypothetical protein